MKSADIWKGQLYVTDMVSRFTSETKVLSPIKILANVEGFIIFTRDGVKQALATKSFTSTYITACKYKLKQRGYKYELSDTLPLRLIKKKVCQ